MVRLIHAGGEQLPTLLYNLLKGPAPVGHVVLAGQVDMPLELMRADHLTDAQATRLGQVLADHPELERAWRMLQYLYGIHLAHSDGDANQARGSFIELWKEHEIAEFLPTVDALIDWADEIFNFHTCDRVTNGRLEGRTNKARRPQTRRIRVHQSRQLRR